MKKLILASTLLLITAGCNSGSKSNMAARSGNGGAETQTLGKGLSGTEPQSGPSADDGIVDSTARQDALDDLSGKIFDSITRLEMDVEGKPEAPKEDAPPKDESKEAAAARETAKAKAAADAQTRAEENVLLKEFISKKLAPKDLTVREALRSGDLKAQVDLKDLQGALKDSDMEFKSIVVGLKRISAIYGFDEAQQEKIEKALIKRQELLSPTKKQIAVINTVSSIISKKLMNLSDAMNSSTPDNDYCYAVGSFLVNYSVILSPGKTFELPASIRNRLDEVKSLMPLVDSCKGDVPGTRATIGKSIKTLFDEADLVQAMIKLYLDPRTQDTDSLIVDVLNRYKALESKEVLEAQNLPTTGDIAVDGIVCTIDGKDFESVQKEVLKEQINGSIPFIKDDESPLSIRKMKGQRGVTLVYQSDRTSIGKDDAVASVNAGEGFVAAVHHFIPGDKTPFELGLKKDEDKGGIIDIVCHSK